MKRSLADFSKAERIRSEGAVDAAVAYLAALRALVAALGAEDLPGVGEALPRLKAWPQHLDCKEADEVSASESRLHQVLTALGVETGGSLNDRLQALLDAPVVAWPERWFPVAPRRAGEWVRLGTRSIRLKALAVTRLDAHSAEVNGVKADVSVLERLGLTVPPHEEPVRALPPDSARRTGSRSGRPTLASHGVSWAVLALAAVPGGALLVAALVVVFDALRPLGQFLCLFASVATAVVGFVAWKFARRSPARRD
jgi:hypothetical protein